MIKEIKYNGYSANPSDYECADGDLATSISLIPENGALKPILPPAEVLQLESGASVMYIHKTANFKHYIIFKNNAVSWWSGSDKDDIVFLRTFSEIYQITAIGNTLLILSTDGMHYFLWKGDDEGYLYLGTKIPECPISFGLQGEMVRTDEFSISFDAISEGSIWNEFSDNNKTRITDQVLAHINKFIAERSTNKGKFIFPFFVRYAYRLYDGTLTMHSSPVLMIASSDLAPQVFWTHITGKGKYTDAQLRVCGMIHNLDYAVILQSRLDMLKNWKDIVRSVDVFVSKPIYTYDQNGKCTKFAQSSSYNSYCVCKHINQAASTSTYPLRYQHHTFNKLYAFTYDPTNFSYPAGRLMIPRRSVDDVKEDIRSTSQFYLLESLRIEQLTTTRTKLVIEEDYLQSLVTREAMTDDYDSHDKLLPKYSFVYNSRLNLANIRKELYSLYNAGALMPHTNGYVAHFSDSYPTVFDRTMSVSVYFYIKQDGRDIIVNGESYQMSILDPPFLFLFYPNINAYKAVIVAYDFLPSYYEVPLEQHKFLNGAFYFGGWDNPAQGGYVSSASPTEQRIIDLPNKIYTSEINNPFHFPVLGINTIGTGTILGISSAVKALSEGQFGQFPLYAFTTEGVWALEVSNTGTYTARQPVTREVCINTNSITQIDNAVLFATNRGIMLISGSTVQCISESLNAEDLFSISDLPRSDKLLSVYNGKASENERTALDDIAMIPFFDFLAACRMIYDYTNQHIIVYNPAVRYAYVFSLKSKLWGMMLSDIVNNVNSYPEALAMADGNRLVDFSTSSAESITALVVTRPFKMDEPDVFKTIDTIIQRGYFKSGHVVQVLYGSNDLFNWHTVWSSTDKYMRGFRGTPYKAFRIALICTLDKSESLLGFSVQFNPRMLNRLR
ncbi:hypothetical protein [Phocaeicola vulgatus]|uniref:hypothetical protein n=1 Tax=Phocaeicola vulgatus TaxID=821 RepID=UPI0021654CE3|nr:hypothetical protein [Phocaeicola vulgatus]MCS2729316.1 hypothetical protein [Phocaeicola vulgatus]